METGKGKTENDTSNVEFGFRFSTFEFPVSIFHFPVSIFQFPFSILPELAMRIREARADDLDAIISIQNRTPEAAQWTQADYARLRSDPLGLILVVELDASSPSTLMGFAAFHRVLDEAELRNMAVDPAQQRKGLGGELLAEGLRRLLELGVKQLFLEVRASNLAAQRLYYSAGFVIRSRRKDYYSDPREDGLVLSAELK